MNLSTQANQNFRKYDNNDFSPVFEMLYVLMSTQLQHLASRHQERLGVNERG